MRHSGLMRISKGESDEDQTRCEDQCEYDQPHHRRMIVTVDRSGYINVNEDEQKNTQAVVRQPEALPPRRWVRDPVAALLEALVA